MTLLGHDFDDRNVRRDYERVLDHSGDSSILKSVILPEVFDLGTMI